MRDQRRFVTTRKMKDPATGKLVSIMVGHFIGSGPRSCVTILRKVQQDLLRQMDRKAKGRFVWWPNLSRPAEQDQAPNTRQVSRAEYRAADKRLSSQIMVDSRRAKQQGAPLPA